MNNIYDFFFPIYQKYGIKAICDALYIHKGTVNRWMEKKEVPQQYYFDLCRVAGIDVDYSSFSNKEKDQFFTSKDTAKYCYDKAIDIITNLGVNLSEYTWIEPSAGDGSFYNLMPEGSIGLDIEPKCDGVISQDFLNWIPDIKKNIIIGNPPFGLRGHLALKFINHGAKFCDFICFILPQLFDSNGKGSCKKRVVGMNLIHSEIIDSSFYYPGGKDVNVNCVFQIWSKNHRLQENIVDLINIIKLYSLSDGGTPGSTRNKKHLYSCDYYLPSTCFGEENMKVYNHFENLPHRRGYGIVVINHHKEIEKVMNTVDWSKQSFKSTNGAFNLRFDLIEKVLWKELPQTVREVAQTPLETALNALY
jgi:hypothetical protein